MNMDRTFHRRFTLGSKCGIVLFLFVAVYFFWMKQPVWGTLGALIVVLIAERALHTQYVFHDRVLIIDKGRLSRPHEIPLDAISDCRKMHNTFGLVHFLIITHSGGRIEAIEPDDEDAFLRYLAKSKR